ncbi:MAG: M20 family metallopeptidase [Acidaminococcaceae bacterium]|jgi:glutamate carboxypeptidase|nr:M20 family metallopeptidase [Acidaminococcaceae bacterium]
MTTYNIEQYMKDLEYLVNIDCNAQNFAGIDKVADYLSKDFTGPMWRVKRIDCGPDCAKPLVITNTDDTDYDVTLCCHMDTVFPDGTVAVRPFSVKGDRAYGPGVSDMKCCCLQATHVLKAMEEAGSLKELKVCLAFNSEEEIGSVHVLSWFQELGSHSKYCLVLEAARATGARVLERKGVCHYQVKLKGRAAHAGNAPQDGRSAINEMAYWVLQLAALTNFETGMTVNTGVVNGGSGYNSVAADAFMDIDLRVVDKAQISIMEEAFAKLQEHAKAAEIETEITTISSMPPMASTPETAGLVEIIDAASRAYGLSTEWVKAGGGSDGNHMSGAGATTVDGIGPTGAGGHSEAEYLELNSVEPSLHCLEKILLDLQEKLYK